MSTSPAIPTSTEIHYWFSKAGLISVVMMAVLIFSGQLGVSSLIAPLSPTTTQIHAASGQAIRAQKIVGLATELAAAKRPGKLYTYRTELAAELNEFVAVHRGLMFGDASRGLDGSMSPEVRDLFNHPQRGLDRRVRDFEQRIRRDFLSDSLTVETGLADDLWVNVRLELSPTFQQLTSLYASEIQKGVGRVYAAQISLIALVVLMMLLLGRFLYRPLAERLANVVRDKNSDQGADSLRFDEVTGLANRTHLVAFMKDLCKFSKEHGLKSAVLDIEITGIEAVREKLESKDVNEMICMVARRLESVCRSGDFIARIGENEFVVVLTNFEDDSLLNDTTNALRTKLSLPFVLATESFGLKTKIGIKIAEPKDQVPAAILNQAATALRIAKASENYDIQFFSGSMAPRANEREKEFRRIEQGLHSGEFRAYFQPVVDIDTSRALAIEALVRWEHPTRGVLPPIHFLETVNNRDLANDVTRAVLGDILNALKSWTARSIEVPFVSLNLNVEQLEDRAFIDELKWTVDSYDQNPSSVAIELSERAFWADKSSVIYENLRRLSSHGFRIVLDDFGAVGKTLPELVDVQLEHLKIERAFITNVDSEPLQQNVAANLIEEASATNVPVIGEGVETPLERSVLQRLGCTGIQGYLICEPVDQEAMTVWLERSATVEPIPQAS